MIIKCSLPQYWQLPAHKRPKSLLDFAAMFPADSIRGLWERKITDSRTGELLEVLWTKNIITNNGALATLKNTFAASATPAVPIFKYMAIGTDAPSTKLTAQVNSGSPITSISVAALPAAAASGTQFRIGYGTPQEQIVTLSAAASSGATSLSINSFTPTATVAANADVVPVPLATDNPTSIAGVQYQTLLDADIQYTAGSGDGNRIATATKTFLGSGTTAGTYTSMRLLNTNPVSNNSTGATLYVAQAAINTNTDQTFSAIISV